MIKFMAMMTLTTTTPTIVFILTWQQSVWFSCWSLTGRSSSSHSSNSSSDSSVDGFSWDAKEFGKFIKQYVEANVLTAVVPEDGPRRFVVVKALCGNSGADVDWLADKFDLDSCLWSGLEGTWFRGHTAARSGFSGMTITSALIQMVEKVAVKMDRARSVVKARVHELLMSLSSRACVGFIYEKGRTDMEEFGPVILASTGFGADLTQDSRLAQYRPDLTHLQDG